MNVSEDNAAPLVAVIDDEQDITTFLECALTDAGYRVVTCNQATTALDLLRAHRPDLICLDLVMPERTGGSLYQAIRRDPILTDIPVLILSGLGSRDEFLELVTAAPDIPPPTGFVDKPIAVEALTASVHAQLPHVPNASEEER